ncbi:MAG TPA: serine hydrolase domain-containing protein, partial [Myxococcota bacterium]
MIALFSLCIALTAAPAPPAFSDDTAATLQAAVDDVLLDTAMGTKAAFTMAVVDHGRVWRHSRGVINARTKQKATTSTSFRLASITKTFTALAIMQLVQDGELDLDTPVTTIVPSLPASLSAVTVRHLLNHTSGIRHYPLKGEERAWRKHLTTAQTLAVFADRPLAFAPGQRFLYTTYGYDVLGAVLEAKTGTAYADVVDERIFSPLGMANTFIEDSRKRRRDWPVGLKLNKKNNIITNNII